MLSCTCRGATGVYMQFTNMLNSLKPFAPTCVSPHARRVIASRSAAPALLQQHFHQDTRPYSAGLINHEPALPRHVPRSVAARAPSIKHQWDTESAKQVCLWTALDLDARLPLSCKHMSAAC